MKYLVLNQKSTGKFRREIINNRPHLLFDVVALEAPSVMNRIFYPAELVFNSIKDLVGKPAPARHPVVNGENVSASHPLAINAHNIGGFVSNVKRDNNQVVAEIALDIEVAEKDNRGKEVIRRIENSERIGFSTGLPWNCDEKTGSYGNEPYDFVINKIEWDHLAILLDEKPAGKNTYNIINCNVQDNSVNIDDNQNISNSEDDSAMFDFKTFVKLLIANSANSFFPSDQARLEALDEVSLVNELYSKSSLPAMTEDDAKKLLAEKGLVTNSADELAEYKAHEVEFKEFLANKAKARKDLIGELVTNSKFDEKTLAAMDDLVLNQLKDSLQAPDYSSRGAQGVRTREKIDDDNVVNFN